MYYLFGCTESLFLQAFSSCGEQGLLIVVASLVVENELCSAAASVVVMHGLSCSWDVESSWIQGSKWCPLHCQEDR